MSKIQDVAKLAGVSVATVSRVLNNSHLVKEETRERVVKAIEELNYKPNMLGRNLRKLSSKAILTLVPNISNAFYSKIVKGIQDTLDTYNYQLLLANTEADWIIEHRYIKLLEHKLVDGLIWMDATAKPEILKEISKDYPVVFCSQYDVIGISYVSIDNELAAYEAVTHLIQQGYKRIGFFNSNLKYSYARLRLQGYKRALNENGIAYDETLVTYVDFDPVKISQAFDLMISYSNPIDSVFTISDMIAQYIIQEARKCNIQVGKEFGLVGFDNLSFSNIIIPALTTVDQPRYRIGSEAANLLLKKILNKKIESKKITLQHQLIIRDSSIKLPNI